MKLHLMSIWLLCAWLVLGGTAASASTITLETGSPTPGTGVMVDVNVVLNGAGTAVGAYDFDFTYTESVLSFVGVTFQGALGDPTAMPIEVFQGSSGGGGLADASEASLLGEAALLALQGDPLLLVQLHFLTLAPGAASVALVNDAGFFLVDAAAQSIGVEAPFPTLMIQIPEPRTLALLAAAALGLRVRRRR